MTETEIAPDGSVAFTQHIRIKPLWIEESQQICGYCGNSKVAKAWDNDLEEFGLFCLDCGRNWQKAISRRQIKADGHSKKAMASGNSFCPLLHMLSSK